MKDIIIVGRGKASKIHTMSYNKFKEKGELVVKGVNTTISFQRKILIHKNFVEGKYDTGFVENVLQKIRKNSANKEIKK